jgi:UDP-N-acetylmuramyl pentapeptide phosphotransferase/UDP-N-acetylglucosamine-1-phosphate transferase
MYAVMAFSLSGSLVAFLIYNFSPAKIFMGDTGSLLIGILNSVFVIKFIAVASDTSSGFVLDSAPALGFAVLIVPLFDTLRVVSLRIVNRRSPFSPDRNHIHHFLLEFGLSHKMISIVCVLTNVLFMALAYMLRSYGTTLVILALTSTSVFLVSIIYYSMPKSKPVSFATQNQNDSILKSRKILTLAGEPLEQD